MQKNYENVILEKDAGIATIVINRPKMLNALNKSTKCELIEALRLIAKDRSAKVVILRGAGGRAFSSGQDIQEAREFNESTVHEWIHEFKELYGAVRALDVPVIAAITGYATGAGWQLALLADIRVATQDSMFGMTEVKVGLPCITGTAILMNYLGPMQIPNLILTGKLIDAREAERLGLVDNVVAREEFDKVVNELARSLEMNSSIAAKLNKDRLRQLTESILDEAYAQALKSHYEAFASGEPQRCMKSFLQKRRQNT